MKNEKESLGADAAEVATAGSSAGDQRPHAAPGTMEIAARLLEVESCIMLARAQHIQERPAHFMSTLLDARSKLGALLTELLTADVAVAAEMNVCVVAPPHVGDSPYDDAVATLVAAFDTLAEGNSDGAITEEMIEAVTEGHAALHVVVNCADDWRKRLQGQPGTCATWLPIESAPKDGTVIVATAADWERPCVLAWRERLGGQNLWDDDSGDSFQNYAPTHWMPLPAPPREERP